VYDQGQLNGRSATWVTPTFLFERRPETSAQRTEAIVSRDFVGALLQLNAEKQISREQLIGAVEDGIQSAYRRVAGDEDIHVRIDAETGKIRVFRARRVVGEIEDEFTEMTIEQAKAFDAGADLGDLVETEQLDGDVFGRIGAQTAKQIVLQRIREVERDQVFDQFASREGELMTGTVNRVEPRAIILDVGKNVEAILATTEQSTLEHYRIGQNVKAFVLEVRRSTKGPQIFVSRTHKGFLKRLFELEVPEIHNGTVEIKAIAREAGSRSKVAVSSRQDGLDPVGATVGQRGARVQAVVAELSGEKIDVIPWSDDASVFVANALSPAQVISVDIDEEHRIASVTVPERMLSLAIGREGQNARLAARLTGWRIDIRSDVSVAEAKAAADAGPAVEAPAEAVGAVESPEIGEVAEGGPGTAPAAKPKRVTKRAAAAAEQDAAAAPIAEAATTEAPAKPKRATKPKAAEAEVDADAAPAVESSAAAKPKRATKTVTAKAEVDDANGTAGATKPAAKAKTTKKAAASVPSGEVAS
jgi:N utilization substance protein A